MVRRARFDAAHGGVMIETETGYAYSNQSRRASDQHQAISDLLDTITQEQISRLVNLPRARCAEVAAGGGSIAAWLVNQVGRAGQVLATDIAPDLIPQHPGLTVLVHDITLGALPGDKYHLVHARLLLNHLTHRRRALEHMVASLAPGGV